MDWASENRKTCLRLSVLFLKIAHEIATISNFSKAMLHVTIPLMVTSFACGAHYVLAPTPLATRWGPQTPILIKSSDHR